MNVVTSMALTAGVSTLGQWTQKKQLTVKTFAGMAFMTIGLMTIEQANRKLAEGFALLILISAIMLYMKPISMALGYSGGRLT